MKKYNYLLVAMLMAVMTVGLSACGSDDDDEPDIGDIDFIELTIDGITKRADYPKGIGNITTDGYKDASDKEMSLFNLTGYDFGRMGDIIMPIAVYTYKSDFNMKTGSYGFRQIKNTGPDVLFEHDWWIFVYEEDDIKKPFETAIWYTASTGEEYYSNSGMLNVKSVKPTKLSLLGIPSDGYIIEATFSCKLVNENNKSDIKDCNGRFSLTYCPEDD